MTYRRAMLCGAVWLMGMAGRAQAYPIPPETLWQLTEKADLVVLATVVRTERHEVTTGDEFFERDLAVLEVKEVWKGRAGAELRVVYGARILCPAPARFEPLLDVLAFLSKGSQGSPHHVIGMSYGTLYPEVRDVPAFRQLVKQALAVQATRDQAKRAAARTDWLVTAAEDPATRWHGLYELDSTGDPAHQYYDDGTRTAGVTLSEAQLQRLVRAFVERPRLDGNLPMLLKLLGKRPSAEVDQTAVAAIDTLLDGKLAPYWTAELIALTRARLGKTPRPAQEKRSREGVLLQPADPLLGGLAVDQAAMRRDWAALRPKLPYPNKRLPWPSRPAVRGIGSESPP